MIVFHQVYFRMNLKLLTLSQSTKNKMWMIKVTIDKCVYYQLSLEYLKKFFIQSWKLLPVKYFHQNCVDPEKGILHIILF